MKLLENKNRIIEIFFTKYNKGGCYGAFFIKEYRLWRFVIVVVKPTLSWKKRDNEATSEKIK